MPTARFRKSRLHGGASAESFNREQEEIAENRKPHEQHCRQSKLTLADQPSYADFSAIFGVERVMARTRAPHRTFLTKSACADFQECPLGRG